MYQWVRPEIAVPVHGEARHLIEHRRFAENLQIPQSVLVENGDLLRLAPGPAKVVDHVAFGRLIADGNALVSAESATIQTRRRLMYNGVAFVTVVLDAAGGLAAAPRITAQGLFHADQGAHDEQDALASAVDQVERALAGLSAKDRADDARLGEAVRTAARRKLRSHRDKRPVVEVQIIRL